MNSDTAPVVEEILADEAATVACGGRLREMIAKAFPSGAVVFLRGNLGAGKTTLVRGILRSMEFNGAVKSPTYTLLEPYDLVQGQVFHFDLYRLQSPQELEFIGFDEIFSGPGLKLIEWPEQGNGWLPQADVEVNLSLCAAASDETFQRRITVRFDEG